MSSTQPLEAPSRRGLRLASDRRQEDHPRAGLREGFATLTTGMAQITALLTTIAGRQRDGS